jgi:hypothetical protein
VGVTEITGGVTGVVAEITGGVTGVVAEITGGVTGVVTDIKGGVTRFGAEFTTLAIDESIPGALVVAAEPGGVVGGGLLRSLMMDEKTF